MNEQLELFPQLDTAMDVSPTALSVYKEPTPLWDGYIVGVWQDAFTIGTPQVRFWAHGCSIQEIVNASMDLPPDFEREGRIMIGNWEIPRNLWAKVKPKAYYEDKPLVIRFMMPVKGGGGGKNGKGLFAIVATLGLAVLTAGISAGWLAGSGTWFTAGSVSARILSAAVSIVGAMVIGALTAPPALQSNGGNTDLKPASITGNVLEPDAPIPTVIGTHWIFPPFAAEPWVEVSGKDEILHAIYILAGAHEIEQIKLGDAVLSGDTDVIIEVRRGLPGDGLLTLNDVQSRTFELNLQMSVHQVSSDNMIQLVTTGNESLPTWHAFGMRRKPEELRLQMSLQGLISDEDRSADLVIPFRIRARARGATDWIYFPEFYYLENTQAQTLMEVVIRFRALSGSIATTGSRGFYAARKTAPAQTDTPAIDAWEADAYFSAGVGNDIYNTATAGTTNVRNMLLTEQAAIFYLDPATFSADFYDFEIIRGMTFLADDWNISAYTVNGVVRSFYHHVGGQLAFTRKNLMDTVQLRRSTNIWFQSPLNQNDLTVISLTARNRSVEKMSVRARGYVYDWTGYTTPLSVADESVANNTAIAAIPNTQAFCMSTEIVLPLNPADGYIFYTTGGGKGVACYVDITAGYFVFRAGDNADATTTSQTAVIQIPLDRMPFDGKKHLLAWNVSTNPVRVKFFCDYQLIADETQTGAAAASAIAGTGGGQFLGSSATIPGYGSAMSALAGAGTGTLTIWHTAQELDESAAAWNRLVLSNNPAPNFRKVLSGVLSAKSVSDRAIDDDILLAWRWHCLCNDYTVDMVAEDIAWWDLLTIIASCGYARPTRAEKFGVYMDYDRSDEDPVQMFTPLQSSDFSWSKAFPQLPPGFRITFSDETYENNAQQIIVRDPNQSGRGDAFEPVTYLGFVNEQKTQKRGLFDLAQARHRGTFFDLKVPSNWLRCKRGSLVSVAYDIVSQHMKYALVKSVITSSGDVTGLILDTTVNIAQTVAPWDLPTNVWDFAGNLWSTGLTYGAIIQKTDGTFVTVVLDDDPSLTSTIMFATPIPVESWAGSNWDGGSVDMLAAGCMVTIGPVSRLERRLIISDIAPANDLTANLTMVDEAPQIWKAQVV